MRFWFSWDRQKEDLREELEAHLRHPAAHDIAGGVLGSIGHACGSAGCWGSSRWLRNLVFGITAHDPTVPLLAVAVPLWQATRVDPREALHEI